MGKILAFQDNVGASFPLLVGQTSYREWEDPPGGNYSLEIVIDRDGIVRAIDNGIDAVEIEPLVQELLAQ